MFLFKDTIRERVLVITFKHRYTPLEDDRAPIKTFVNEVHGAPGYFHPVEYCLPLGVQPGETREQGRVDIDHLPGKFPGRSPSPRMRM